jgi:mono/diheme cytochrome c family protein
MTRTVFVSVAVLALAACGSARRSEPLTGPVALPSDAARAGEVVFMRECHACHPGGEAGLGPALNNKPLPGFLIATQVRLGAGAMPAFSQSEIPPADLDALLAYLKARRATPPRAP